MHVDQTPYSTFRSRIATQINLHLSSWSEPTKQSTNPAISQAKQRHTVNRYAYSKTHTHRLSLSAPLWMDHGALAVSICLPLLLIIYQRECLTLKESVETNSIIAVLNNSDFIANTKYTLALIFLFSLLWHCVCTWRNGKVNERELQKTAKTTTKWLVMAQRLKTHAHITGLPKQEGKTRSNANLPLNNVDETQFSIVNINTSNGSSSSSGGLITKLTMMALFVCCCWHILFIIVVVDKQHQQHRIREDYNEQIRNLSQQKLHTHTHRHTDIGFYLRFNFCDLCMCWWLKRFVFHAFVTACVRFKILSCSKCVCMFKTLSNTLAHTCTLFECANYSQKTF